MLRRCFLRLRFSLPGRLLTGTLLAALCAGCAGYRLGSTLPPDINVVHVPTFVNETPEPRLEIEATQATIREIQRDGTLSISDLQLADVVLDVRLIKFKLEPLRYEADNVVATKEYRLTITAGLTLTNRKTDTIMIRNTVQGEADFVPTGDLSSAKRDALPVAAKDLAHDIVESVVEYW